MNHTESSIQIACVTWFRLQYRDLSNVLIAVPNGGKRRLLEAVAMKKEGVTKGVADLLLLTPRKGFGCLCIEMKTKRGLHRKSQKDWQKEIEKAGNKYVVCRSLEQFIKEINNYLK